MCVQFTDGDVEKTVENANGEVIGTITAVEGDTARVDPDPGMMGSIRAALGWSQSPDDAVVIHEDAVADVTDDVLRLGAEPNAQNRGSAGTELGSESGSESEPASGSVTGTDSEPAADPESSTERAAESERSDATGETDREFVSDEPTPGPGLADDAETSDAESMAETRVSDEVSVDDAPQMPTREADDGADDADAVDLSEGGRREDEHNELTGIGRNESEATAPSDEPDAAEDDTVDGETGERPARDALEGADETTVTDAVADVETESERSGTEETTLVDKVNRGVDIDSIAADDASEETGGTDGPDASSGDRESADELDYEIGTDPVSTIGDTGETDGSRERPATGERDLADELNVGTDLESVAGSGEPAADGDAQDATAETNLVDELNRGVDIEVVAKTDRQAAGETGIDVDVDEDTAPVDAEMGPETEARRIAPEIDSEAESETDEAARDEGRTGAEIEVESDDRTVTSDSRRDRSRSKSPLGSLLAAQRTAIEQGRRTFEQGLRTQRRATRNALKGQGRLQRRSIELVRTAADRYVAVLAGMAGGGTERSADQGRDSARRLELVDGIDERYRRRLESAGITSLDDLARADVEAVADAAAVPEKRARSWIEQVSV